MSKRFETLKKSRARMIEERDVHAKVLAAPFDRDKAERARNKFIEIQMLVDALDPSVERKSFCRKAEPRRQGGAASIKMAIRGRRAHSCAMRVFRLRRTNFLVQALDPTAGDECRLGAMSFRASARLEGAR